VRDPEFFLSLALTHVWCRSRMGGCRGLRGGYGDPRRFTHGFHSCEPWEVAGWCMVCCAARGRWCAAN